MANSPINTKLIAAIGYNQIPTSSLTAFSESAVVFGTADVNTSGAYDTATGAFTVPYSGLYQCSAVVSINGVAVTPNNIGASVSIRKNGQTVISSCVLTFTSGTAYGASVSYAVMCEAGDILQFWSRSDMTTPSFSPLLYDSGFSIVRVGV